MFSLFVAQVVAPLPSSGDGVMDWIKIIAGAGVAGVMLWLVISKVIPKILDKHEKERKELRADHAKERKELREDHATLQNTYLAQLDKIEDRAEKSQATFVSQIESERKARESQFRESTAVGSAQAVATIQLNETMSGLRSDVNTNTEVLRSLEKQRKKMVTSSQGKTATELLAVQEVKR